MALSDKALQATIDALEAELKGSLAKAEGEESASTPPEASDDSASSAPPETPPSSPSGPPASPEAPPAGPPDAPPADAGAPAPGGDPAAEQIDPAALQAEYSQLPPDQLDMHIQAALAAKQALAGASGAPAQPPMAPPAGPPPGMGKNEITTTPKEANGGMVKSEVEALKAELQALKKSMASRDEDIEILTKWAEKSVVPQRKAVVGLAKSEEKVVFSPKDAKDLLNENLGKLSKSERDLVMRFNLGHVKVDALASIFEKITQ